MSTITSYFSQTPKAYCGGLRSNTRRAFVRGNPPFLLLSLDIFARQGTITDVTHLPQIIQVSSDRYVSEVVTDIVGHFLVIAI